MKRFLMLIIVSILMLAMIAGCSASTTQTNQRDYQETTAATTAAEFGADKGAAVNDPSIPRKIIRNASLDLETVDIVAAYDALLAYAAQHGGYELNRSQSTSGSGYLSIDAQIKINPEYLDAFLVYAATQADVINSNTVSDDITSDYYDTQTRLKTMELSLEQYYVYLDKATTIDESLQVQNQINNLTVEIESLKGRLKVWDNQLAESTITIRLRQPSDPVKIKKEINWSALTFEDMGFLMKSGLMSVVNVLVSIVQWLAIILVAAAPVWIIVLILILVINRLVKRSRRRKALSQNKPMPPPMSPQP